MIGSGSFGSVIFAELTTMQARALEGLEHRGFAAGVRPVDGRALEPMLGLHARQFSRQSSFPAASRPQSLAAKFRVCSLRKLRKFETENWSNMDLN